MRHSTKTAAENRKKAEDAHKKTGGQSRRHLRTLVSVLFSFLLAMCLTALLAAVALHFGFFNREMTLHKINESDYYTNVYQELLDNLNTIADSKELPQTIVTTVFTEKRVYINGKNFIENSLDDADTVVAVDGIQEELNTAITAYYRTKNVQLTDAVKSDISATIQAMTSEYTRMVRFQFVDYIRKYKAACDHVFCWLLPVLGGISIVLLVLLLKLHRYLHQGVRYIGISLVSAGLLNLILPLFALLQKWYTEIAVTPEYYAQFLSEYFKWSLYSFIYTGLISIVISAALFIWMRFLKNQIK